MHLMCAVCAHLGHRTCSPLLASASRHITSMPDMQMVTEEGHFMSGVRAENCNMLGLRPDTSRPDLDNEEDRNQAKALKKTLLVYPVTEKQVAAAPGHLGPRCQTRL